MMWVAAWVLALGVGPPPTATTVDMQFLGFSRNERSAAWQLTLQQPNAHGGEDRFVLVQLVDIAHNRLVANFRRGSVHRQAAGGGRLPGGAQAAELPEDWRRAQSERLWQLAARKGQFAHKAIDFKSALVRVFPDADSQLGAKGDAKRKRMDLRHAGGGFGFTVVGTLFDGSLVPLGHFRLPEGVRAEHAHLQVWHSKTARRVAVMVTFAGMGPHAPPADIGGALFYLAQDRPLGTTQTGSLAVMQQQSQSVEAFFKQMHPEGAKTWDVFVGRWF